MLNHVPSADPALRVDSPASINPLESLAAARMLHELLGEHPVMLAIERKQVARQISGRLFAVESDRIFPDRLRFYFRELRTDAHRRAVEIKSLPRNSEIWHGYDQLQNELEDLLGVAPKPVTLCSSIGR